MRVSARLLALCWFLTLFPTSAGAFFLPNALPQHSSRLDLSLPTTHLPRPGQDMTRAAFVASLVAQLFPPADASCFHRLSRSQYDLLFPDVSIHDPYAPQLCVAMEAGIIRGYPDGYFRPQQMINAAEAAKVIAKSYGIADDATDPHVPWYQPSVDALAGLGLPFPGPSLADSYPADRAKFAVWVVRCSQFPGVLLREQEAAPREYP